jgi:hypothetical protein
MAVAEIVVPCIGAVGEMGSDLLSSFFVLFGLTMRPTLLAHADEVIE